MADRTAPRARRARPSQPSLWDRLVNDLPGVASEIDGLRQSLAASSAPSGSTRSSPPARAASTPMPRSAGARRSACRG